MKDEFYFSLHAPEANSVEEAVGNLRGLLAGVLAAKGAYRGEYLLYPLFLQ